MNFKWNNVRPACCAKWLVLPTVYSDALSYGEQLDKFCYQLNQLIENNNILPDFIAEMIKEYINSGAIGEVVRDILADYILNVKYPPEGITPAVGDGSADDTAAIQGCIDYAAENGGVVYFPYGSYLTQPLTMKDGVSLFGFDRYSTKIVLKGGATKPLIGGTVADLSIANLTLDGNSGIQVNDVNVVTIIGTNVLFTNMIIKDGYTLVNYVGTGGHFQISDVVFGNAVEKCLLTAGNADVQCENAVFNHLSAVGGISVMDIGTDGGFFNVKSVATCNQCIVVSGNKNKISAIVENATTPFVDNGLQNNVEIFGVSNKEFFSGDTTMEVGGNYSKHVAGAYTKAVDGNANESVNGNLSSIVNGVTTETYNDDKNVSGTNESKTLSGKKTVNAGILEETVSGNKTVNAINGETHTGREMAILTDNPLKYSKPVSNEDLLPGAEFVEMTDVDGNKYNLLAYSPNSKILIPVKSVKYYGAKGDGVTDDTEAINKCITNESLIYFPAGTYKVTGTFTLDNKRIVGEHKSSTFLRKDGDGTLINAGSRTQIENITLGFYNADGAGYNEKIAINCMGSQYPLQRTSISNVNIWICGTGIKSGSEPLFSVNFDSMEITEFTFAAIHIDTPDSTQSAFRNLYITSSKEPVYMFIVYTRMSSIYLENINLEHTAPKNDPLILVGVVEATVNGVQFEGDTLTEQVGLMTISCKNITINRFTNIFNTLKAGANYGIAVHIGTCTEFDSFATSDMKFSYAVSTITINDYFMWGFNFNGKALTFARRDNNAPLLNLYINGFAAVTYNDDIDKYDLYVQADDTTNVIKNLNNNYGNTLPAKFITKYGEIYFDTSDGKLKYYNGTTWKAIVAE